MPRLIPVSRITVGTIRTFGTGMFLFGFVVMAQNPQRWGGPQYASITAVARPFVWGAVMASLGFFTIVGSLTGLFILRNIGLYGCALWLGLFAVGVFDVAHHDPHVSFSGCVPYATLGVAMCLAARAREVPAFDAGLPPVL